MTTRRTRRPPGLQSVIAGTLAQISVATAALTLALTLIAALMQSRQSAQGAVEAFAWRAADAAAPALAADDQAGVEAAILPLRDAANAAGVTAIDVRRPDGQPLTTLVRTGHSGGDPLFAVRAQVPVRSAGSGGGSVRVTASPPGVAALLLVGIGAACLAMVVAIAASHRVARRLHRRLLDPIDRLAMVAQQALGPDQASMPAGPPPGGSIAEVDVLTRTIDGLRADLAGWQARVQASTAALERRAMLDPLCGLPNRAAFIVAVEAALQRGQRTQAPFAILFCDGDRFKAINDGFGHAAGDMVIREVGRRIAAVLRSGDVVARIGGDEFALLVNNIDSAADVAAVLARIKAAILVPIAIGSRQVGVTISCGASLFPDDGGTAEALIHCADERMYAAKFAAGNRDRRRPVRRWPTSA